MKVFHDNSKYAMQSAVIELSPLFDLIRNDPHGEGLLSRTETSNEYGKVVNKLLKQHLKHIPGFYLWLSQESKEIIYVGKANDLHRRLSENLKHSRVALYAKIYGMQDEWLERVSSRYPEMWRVYQNNWKSAEKRQAADSLLYVGSEDLAHLRLELVESHLIKKLKPKANVQNVELSTEYQSLRPISLEVIEACSLNVMSAIQRTVPFMLRNE